MKKKNSYLLELEIERLALGGEGIGHVEGKATFVPWTAPGDKVRAEIVREARRHTETRLHSVLQPALGRVVPRCPVFQQCGGCQWQHLTYEDQLRFKEQLFTEALERIGHLQQPVVRPIRGADQPWNYRNRIRVNRSATGAWGFYRYRSRETVPVTDCAIAAPEINQHLKNLESRGAAGERVVELQWDAVHGLVRMVDPSDEERTFAQVNPAQNTALVEVVVQAVCGRAHEPFRRKLRVLELFAGAGNFTIPLSREVGEMVAVEFSRQAIDQARANTPEKGGEIHWVVGRADWAAQQLARRGEKFDVVLLDPPRRGAAEVMELVVLLQPMVVVYVSCDPATLARDLQTLVRRGYRVDYSQPVDLFPQTHHIESVTRLVRDGG